MNPSCSSFWAFLLPPPPVTAAQAIIETVSKPRELIVLFEDDEKSPTADMILEAVNEKKNFALNTLLRNPRISCP